MLLGINTKPKQLFKVEYVFQQFRADIVVRYHIIHYLQNLWALKTKEQDAEYTICAYNYAAGDCSQRLYFLHTSESFQVATYTVQL